mmetsp:Transcript_16939/g.37519  ORF Transcript_16939/g.37519 Transcript_16939/m.37519 type:complete len:118 (+) Transcript_16939:361-714(+)
MINDWEGLIATNGPKSQAGPEFQCIPIESVVMLQRDATPLALLCWPMIGGIATAKNFQILRHDRAPRKICKREIRSQIQYHVTAETFVCITTNACLIDSKIPEGGEQRAIISSYSMK